jgi:sugar/nucleoside kinase (ribokinase family)
MARAAGSLVSFDVNYRPALWDNPAQAIDLTLQTLPGVDMIKVNEGEASLISGREVDPADQDSLHAAASTILDRGIKAVILTLGPQGSFFEVETGYGYVPGFEVNTVDAVGCGDSFVAGLLSQLVGDSDWKERLEPAYLKQALRYANAIGALTSLTQGVIPALPRTEQVDAFLKNR